MKKLYDIIINPVSGKGKGKKALSSVLKFLNANDVDHKIYLTTKRGDAEKFAKELTSGEEERNIVAIGGDGTFSEVLDGIVNFEKTMLGFIMSGTGNDFGSHLKLNKDPERAFKDILGGWVEYVDFIQ
ncbi:MAG: acylglycerol kinase family protein, partial [Firmicutes bacterium]|nr:acylglycerol kinase family protein [Bacillota bacterium]